MTTEEIHPLRRTIAERFGGVLKCGSHAEDGEACALEAAHVAAGRAWSDAPDWWPDLRPINDGPWSSSDLRTEHLTQVLVAVWEWNSWSVHRRLRWAEIVALRTVNEILPVTLRAVGLDAEASACASAHDLACASAHDLVCALMAALMAAGEAARVAAMAAGEAARAAAVAAWAARAAAAADTVLILACQIWIDAAEATK